MVAVLSLSVLTAPPSALAKGKKVPPGQAKKINFQVMNDIRNHWSVEPVTALQKEGIIKGYSDGNFYPQNEVSRCEGLVMVMRALNQEGGTPSKEALKAAADCPDWAKNTVALAIDKGIITGQEAEDLDFSKPALRYEVAVWLGRAQNGNVSTGNLTFADSGKIPDYAKKYVAFMAKNRIINGYPGNMFGPLNSVKRAEIAAMLFRCQNMFSLKNQFGYVRGEVKDILPSAPAFIVLAVGDGDNAGEMMIQVADDAAIFVDGVAAELGDIKEGESVTVVLNPARKAIVISVKDGENNNDSESNAPKIAGLSPKDGAKDVEIGLKQLVATFNENIRAVNSESDVGSKIVVTNETGNKTVEIKDIDISGKELTIELVNGLNAGCEYTVYIPPGVIIGEDGNSFDGVDDSDWNFTTAEEEDNTAPDINSLDPEDNDDVLGDVHELTAKFDENVQWAGGNDVNAGKIIIFKDNTEITPDDIKLNDNELVINFDEALSKGEYSVIIPSGIIEDEAGNSFKGIGINGWNFEIKAALA